MQANTFALFLSVAGAHFIALLSPGVDFILIVKNGLAKPLSRAFGIAVGISAANGVYIALCLAGLASLIAASPSLVAGIQAAGGSYLVWLGIKAVRSRRSADDVYGTDAPVDRDGSAGTVWRDEFFTGFGSAILNPKLPLFYLGLFSLLAGTGASVAFKVFLGAWMTAVVLAWDSCILFALTRERLRARFLRSVRLVDIVTGSILALIGVRLLVLAASSVIR